MKRKIDHLETAKSLKAALDKANFIIENTNKSSAVHKAARSAQLHLRSVCSELDDQFFAENPGATPEETPYYGK